MTSKNHKKVYSTLIDIEQFLILLSTITGWISISALASLVSISIRIASFTRGLKIGAVTPRIKNYKWIIKKKKKKHDKIALLLKTKSYFLRRYSIQIIVIINLF